MPEFRRSEYTETAIAKPEFELIYGWRQYIFLSVSPCIRKSTSFWPKLTIKESQDTTFVWQVLWKHRETILISSLYGRLFSKSDSSLVVLKRLVLENVGDYAGRYILAFLCMALVAATTAGSAYIMSDVVEQIFEKQDMKALLWISLTVVAIFVVKGAANFGQNVILTKIGNNIVARCQSRMYQRLMMQGLDFFHTFQSDSLITRMSHNAQAARAVLQMLVTSVGRDILSLIGLTAVMIIREPFMSAFAFFIAGPAILGITLLVRKVKKIAKAEFQSLTRVISTMQETVPGIRLIKSFNLESVMQDRMDEAVQDVEKRANKLAVLAASTSPLMETLGGIAVGAVIFYSGWSAAETGRSAGDFMSFLMALLLAYDPAKRLARLQVNMEGGLVGVRLMYDLLDAPLTMKQLENAPDLEVSKGDIVLNAVSFAYENPDRVVNNLDLVARGGEMTALVGPSGGGKSTLLGLIQRFHDVCEGSITIDNQNVDGVQLASLRRNISYVSQDTFLFSGTIRDNIMLGRPRATVDEMVESAKAACAHEFIMDLPFGYDTETGENGAKLSGGQKQRIAIARALLKDAPIVLLDEATSALDSESEARVQLALDELLRDKTSIVIAHRLSTIRRADKICVIREGMLVEQGNHKDLLDKAGVYASLHALQFGEVAS